MVLKRSNFSLLFLFEQNIDEQKNGTLLETPVDGVASDSIFDLDSDSVPNEAVTLAVFEDAFTRLVIVVGNLA